MEKRRLNPARYIIISNFFHNVYRVMISAQPISQYTQETKFYPFLHFGQQQMYFWYMNFSVKNHFIKYIH